MEFEEIFKVGNKRTVKSVTKDLVLVKDPIELVNHVCKERDITVQCATYSSTCRN